MNQRKIYRFDNFAALKSQIKGQSELFQAQALNRPSRPFIDQDFPSEWWCYRGIESTPNPLLIIGGMGTLAGLQAFGQAVQAYPDRLIYLCQATQIIDRAYAISQFLEGNGKFKKEVEQKLADYIDESIEIMALPPRVDLIIACNTAHFFLDGMFDKIKSKSTIHFLSIVEGALKAAAAGGFQNVLCLMTTGSVDGKVYSKHYPNYVPNFYEACGQQAQALMGAISAVKAFNLEEAQNLGSQFFNQLDDICRYDAIISGCTEIPEIINTASANDPSLKQILKKIEIISPFEEGLKMAHRR